jgi:hypothetical protein
MEVAKSPCRRIAGKKAQVERRGPGMRRGNPFSPTAYPNAVAPGIWYNRQPDKGEMPCQRPEPLVFW